MRLVPPPDQDVGVAQVGEGHDVADVEGPRLIGHGLGLAQARHHRQGHHRLAVEPGGALRVVR
jgi:hypothetical protein